jgi:flagellar hook protein FlgE
MSFQQGLSGLNATSKNLEVIGNNVANAGTIGAKASRAEFADVYAASLNGAGNSPVGIGVTMQKVAQQFTQGNISTTSNQLDMAINGDGFFQLQASQTDKSLTYTRNGQFKVDSQGWIVNNENQLLVGATGPLQLNSAIGTPQATASIVMAMNFDSTADVTADAAAPRLMDTTDTGTYNNATSTTVYDATGAEVSLTLYVQRAPADAAGNNVWNVYASADGQPVGGGTMRALTPVSELVFPASGIGPTVTQIAPLTIPAFGDHQAITVTDFNLTDSTQFAGSFGVTRLEPDGRAQGELTGVSIGSDGQIMARFSNGQTLDAGQIELVTFRNPQGLQPLGGNGWAQTSESGRPVRNTPGQGGSGLIQAGALEESNVDLTAELVNMITAQRIYQANAQTIKTQDQVLQTLVNMR